MLGKLAAGANPDDPAGLARLSEELRKRHDFLSGQKADLELAAGEIVWIPGVCRSDAATARPGRPAISIRCERYRR